MEGQTAVLDRPRVDQSYTSDPPADLRIRETVVKELDQARAGCEHHSIELERNQRIVRACEAALSQLDSQVDGPPRPAY